MESEPRIRSGDGAKDCEKAMIQLSRGTEIGDRFFKLKEKLEKDHGFVLSSKQILSWLLNEAKA